MLFRIIFIFYCLIFIPLSYGKDFTEVRKKFSKTVASELKKHNIPGAAYVIIQNNKVVALETFGYTDKSKSKKINADTVFRLASVSKPFAATITTMLAQEKRLNLSDPITQYIPNFVLAKKNASKKIQIKHLLSHSSGLMPNAYDNLLHENWNMQKIIGRFDRVSPICQPGICYGYQNIAYGFLQFAIENSQPKSYATLLQERIFTPLKMDNASVGIDNFLNNKNIAKPHVLIRSKRTGKKDKNGRYIKQNVWHPVKVQPDYYKVAPAAGVNASITDLAKWLNANMGNNPDILSPNLLNELTTPRIKTKKDLRRRYWKESLKDAYYGYGWRIYQLDKSSIIYHSGWVQGYRADIGYSPELGIGFAMLMNAESNLINKLSHDFWKAVQQ
ncbi:serine hydrolase domain-containing protein [Colwellia sp. RE-S-Sl-9]